MAWPKLKRDKMVETIMSPQDEKNKQSEKEKKLVALARQEIEDEFYSNANLDRLFRPEDPVSGFAVYLPYVQLGVGIITLLVLFLKKYG